MATTTPTLTQQRAIAYTPKPFAAISLLASAFVLHHLFRHPEKRRRLYHRLIGAMNVFISIRSIILLWGNWAVPEGTAHFVGAMGTVETCTTQGFISILTSISVASYFASLSICSYVSIKNKFKEENYKWVEKWLHGANICLPSGYAVWMAVTENINPYGGGCFVAVSPLGCGAHPDIPCERGSLQVGTMAMIIIGMAQLFLYLVIPPFAMFKVWGLMEEAKKEYQTSAGMKNMIESARKKMLRDLFWQISLYLFSFWVTYIFGLVHLIIRKATGEITYDLLIVSNVMNSSQGFIAMLVYFQLQNMTCNDQEFPKAPAYNGRSRQTTIQIIRNRALSLSRVSEHGGQDTHHQTGRMSRVSFCIFDGTPDESSPWAKYIDRETLDDELCDEVEEGFSRNEMSM